MSEPGSVEIVRASPEHEPAIIGLLSATLQWSPDNRHQALFAWKHRENAFGESPAWVALHEGRLVGFRTFMRWQFDWNGSTMTAVRAVDTATAPEYQGQGIFSRLTRHALDELKSEGVDFVFNTPNAQSRPGYLKMGWQPVGRLRVSARPTSVRRVGHLLRARGASTLWSEATHAGEGAQEVLASDGAEESLRGLIASQPAPHGLRTRWSPRFFAWRYGHEVVAYRVLLRGADFARGAAFFRIRQRGTAREAVLADVLAPDGDPRVERDLRRRVAGLVDADYVVQIGDHSGFADGYVVVPGQGPILTWRSVCAGEMPPRSSWHVSLGDVELF